MSNEERYKFVSSRVSEETLRNIASLEVDSNGTPLKAYDAENHILADFQNLAPKNMEVFQNSADLIQQQTQNNSQKNAEEEIRINSSNDNRSNLSDIDYFSQSAIQMLKNIKSTPSKQLDEVNHTLGDLLAKVNGQSSLDYLEKYIQHRMAEIIANRINVGVGRQIAIVNGEPVLKDDSFEYAVLKKFESTFNQRYQLNNSVPAFSIQNNNVSISPDELKRQEIKQINDRIANIEANGRNTIKSMPVQASNGQYIHVEDMQEYESLLTLLGIIKNNFQSNLDDYLTIRGKTNLSYLPKDLLEVMVGHTLANTTELENPGNSQIDIPSLGIEKKVYEGEVIGEPIKHNIKEEPPIIDADYKDIPSPDGYKVYEGEVIGDPIKQTIKDNPTIIDIDYTEIPEDEELQEIVEITPWQWIKEHKKQILVGLGITALSITTIMALTELMPAILAANKASQIANIAAQMTTNSQMWFTASATEKLALHSANTALADVIASLTGVTNSFNISSGVWTLGAENLASFAASATATAKAATLKVASASTLAKLGGLGGLSALGTGLITKKKSKEYYTIKNIIDEYKRSFKNYSELENITKQQEIENMILSSSTLSDAEKNILQKKINTLKKKINKYWVNQNENEFSSMAFMPV